MDFVEETSALMQDIDSCVGMMVNDVFTFGYVNGWYIQPFVHRVNTFSQYVITEHIRRFEVAQSFDETIARPTSGFPAALPVGANIYTNTNLSNPLYRAFHQMLADIQQADQDVNSLDYFPVELRLKVEDLLDCIAEFISKLKVIPTLTHCFEVLQLRDEITQLASILTSLYPQYYTLQSKKTH